jgi:hypothetical protein
MACQHDSLKLNGRLSLKLFLMTITPGDSTSESVHEPELTTVTRPFWAVGLA